MSRPAEEIRADLATWAARETSWSWPTTVGGWMAMMHLAADVAPLLVDRERLSAELADARAENERLTGASECNHLAKVEWFHRAVAAERALEAVRAQVVDTLDSVRAMDPPKTVDRKLASLRHWVAALSAASPTTSDDENACRDCGIDNPVWFAPNDVWNAVMGDHTGFLCPRCFIVRAETSGLLPTAWVLTPEAPAPATSDEPARPPDLMAALRASVEAYREAAKQRRLGPAASGTPHGEPADCWPGSDR